MWHQGHPKYIQSYLDDLLEFVYDTKFKYNDSGIMENFNQNHQNKISQITTYGLKLGEKTC